MSEKIQYTIYNIAKCGLYLRGKNPDFYTNYTEIFTDLIMWIRGRNNIIETVTFKPSDENDTENVYCFDTAQVNAGHSEQDKHFLLTIWNGVPTKEGQVGAINGRGSPGNAQTEVSEFSEDYIPGYPTYFWILPEKNLVVPVHFDDQKYGITNFIAYVKNFIGQYSRRALRTATGPDSITVCYLDDNSNKVNANPYFVIKKLLRNDPKEYLISRINEIKSVIKKVPIESRATARNQDLWQKLVSFLGLATASRSDSLTVNFLGEYAFQPSRSEFDEIISNWEEDHYGRVGFKLKTGSTIWLDNFDTSGKLVINVDRDAAGIVNAERLLQILEENKNEILAHNSPAVG